MTIEIKRTKLPVLNTENPLPNTSVPVQSAPVQSAPVQSAPVQSAPVQSAPVQSAPDLIPEQSAPDLTPVEPCHQNSSYMSNIMSYFKSRSVLYIVIIIIIGCLVYYYYANPRNKTINNNASDNNNNSSDISKNLNDNSIFEYIIIKDNKLYKVSKSLFEQLNNDNNFKEYKMNK